MCLGMWCSGDESWSDGGCFQQFWEVGYGDVGMVVLCCLCIVYVVFCFVIIVLCVCC